MVNRDTVACDMLTRIRNAILVKSRKVIILRTNLTLNIASILKKEGFIESFEEYGDVFLTEKTCVQKYILIVLRYKGVKQKSYITSLKRISKPGLRVYINYKNIPKVLGGIGIAVLSTSKGLLTDRAARFNKLGGEVLFYIW
uniref:Small ribosomal subunit protein uS8c n=1 Tax=Euglena clara TaxID=215708 RepID=A0A2Z4YVX3_9EUGL|nr:ribosomal protein S8 [Euglena clara]AXA45479.1 ribosomal protein S8 [Euglena clara]